MSKTLAPASRDTLLLPTHRAHVRTRGDARPSLAPPRHRTCSRFSPPPPDPHLPTRLKPALRLARCMSHWRVQDHPRASPPSSRPSIFSSPAHSAPAGRVSAQTRARVREGTHVRARPVSIRPASRGFRTGPYAREDGGHAAGRDDRDDCDDRHVRSAMQRGAPWRLTRSWTRRKRSTAHTRTALPREGRMRRRCRTVSRRDGRVRRTTSAFPHAPLRAPIAPAHTQRSAPAGAPRDAPRIFLRLGVPRGSLVGSAFASLSFLPCMGPFCDSLLRPTQPRSYIRV
jgi:hypothetical protein